MKISVKVKPNAKIEKVEKLADNEFAVWVTAQAKEGKANQAAVELLSEYFGIPKSRINIVTGYKSKNKIISIES